MSAGIGDDRALALLVGALERPSPSGEEAAVAGFLRDALLDAGVGARIDESGSVRATVGTGSRRIVLLGHIDTVAGHWPVRHEAGIVHGRGAVDAKGPFCAMAVAMTRLTPAARSALTVDLVGATEEEAPSSRGARHAVATLPLPEFVVIGEPSGWDALTLGYKGRLVLRVTARVPTVHTARDEATASELVVDAFAAARAWARGRSASASGAFDAVQVALLALASHEDGFAGTANATIAFRLPPGLDPIAASAEATAAIAPGERGAGALSVVATGSERAYRGERDTALTRAFRTAIRRHGGAPRLTLKTGTSDMNVVAPAWDVPMLAYGPGDAALDHTSDEHVRSDDYVRAIAVIVDALESLAASPPGVRGRSARSSSG
jgi:[amino group carrier protein]-lysine/ornithine hydrolase